MNLKLGLYALILVPIISRPATGEPPTFEFTRMIAHWANYAGDDYLQFVKEAQPELAQIGFYGGHFWSLAHTPQYKGYPAHFPVRGLNECGQWFVRRNAAIQKLQAKVVGHFNVEFLVGDPAGPKGPRGFFKFYHQLWDTKLLGPKPVADPLAMMERDLNGKPITQKGYGIGGMKEYWACLRNPHWQTVLKAWTRVAIKRGVDGLMINYFYRHNCRCQHCERGFRKYLSQRFKTEQLKKLGISNLATHKFKELVFWHDPAKSTPLRREMLRWSQISNKQIFDEVFVKYGRSLKPDLIVGQWNHLGNFGQISGDERCLLPGDLWGKDESYLWYSAGGSANYTDLKQRHFLGDVTLQARYIRSAFHDKPFVIGKYEITRVRSAIAELAANGGAPMGFYTRFTDPLARREIVRYYQFLKRNDELFRGSRSHAEVALIFPRSQIHAGKLAPLNRFRQLGRRLLEKHVLFDVIPDDMASVKRRKRYKVVVAVEQDLSQSSAQLSQFEAPVTVRVAASRSFQKNDLVLHYVNYNRTEPKRAANGRPSAGGGIKDEKPIAVSGIRSDIVVPTGKQVAAVEFLTPEKTPTTVAHSRRNGRLQFAVPKFLVYGIIRIRFQD